MKRCLLLTIDFINDLVHPSGKLSSCAQMVLEQDTIHRTNTAIMWARAQAMTVAHVKVGFPAGYANCPLTSPLFKQAPANEVLLLDSWGTAFHEGLAVSPQDFIIIKPRVSVFYNTNLESLLRARAVDTLILCGVWTNMAVEMAVREAHDRDYQVIVLADCCAASTADVHRQTLTGTVSQLADVTTLDALKASVNDLSI